MNRTKYSTAKAGSALCGTLAVTFAGCTTYVEQPAASTMYVPPPVQPLPPVVEVPPPPPPPDAPVVVIQSEGDFDEPLRR